ncbi:hypothetical protein ACFFSY_09735 [Paenibacillus aurantiacus]|uniref:Uncharacterized protein n=1 Tax=Paenibacillus aurantiacus TaxID=1936118 RepID=A0ABV5KLS8_9BACL
MANPFVNKKKVRGWKRRIREVDMWKNNYLHLDIEELNRTQRKYLKIWLDPWNRLVKRTPPVWFSRIILQALLDVYNAWYKKLKATGEPFYLKIWLYSPNFVHSQVVCAVGDALNYYDDTFDKGTVRKEFPTKFSNLPNIESLEWELCLDSITYWDSELKENIAEGYETISSYNNIVQRSYASGQMKLSYGNDTYYKIKVGDVWLGSLNATK